MQIYGRSRELGILRTALDRPDAAVVALSGQPGSGATDLALAAAGDLARVVYHRVPPLTEPQQRQALATTLLRGGPSGNNAPHLDGSSGWELLLATPGAASAGGAVLVLDDAHRLDQSRARFLPALRAVIEDARRRSRRFHVVLCSPEQPALDPSMEEALRVARLALGPLPFRAAQPLLPGATVLDRLRAYAVFGGLPGHLALLDRGVALQTNLRRLVLDEGGPLADEPLALLERSAQVPSRYAAILSALSHGEADWKHVHAGVPDVTASGQVAPYLNRLAGLGLVEVRRSLDAGPNSRGRRYRIVDPFLAFWFRFVLPHRDALAGADSLDEVTTVLRGSLDEHVTATLPEVCRQYMRQDAIETMGSNAREWGSLWGGGYEIPVAGILSSGAVFYGAPVALGSDGIPELEALERAIRETRYGFGRERRLRVLFTAGSPSTALARAAARRHDVVIVDGRGLSGEN